MKKSRLSLRIASLTAALFIGGCGYQAGHMGMTSAPASFDSNGERIYYTGTSDRGSAISSTGGGMHMRMMRGACADCHGPDRGGGIAMMPYFWETAPALTAGALFGDHGEGGDGHGGHDAYDDHTLRRAIRQGIDPAGEPLDDLMPRWRMSEQDLDDLIAFLKS